MSNREISEEEQDPHYNLSPQPRHTAAKAALVVPVLMGVMGITPEETPLDEVVEDASGLGGVDDVVDDALDSGLQRAVRWAAGVEEDPSVNNKTLQELGPDESTQP